VIHEVLRRLAPDGDLRCYEALMAAGGGMFKGEQMLAGFIMIRPGDEITRQLDLLQNLDDASHVAHHITPPDQVFAIASLASTPPELVHRDVTTSGHLGLFMGHEALREHWPPILAEVLRHSRSR
jgi:hypothetical protein